MYELYDNVIHKNCNVIHFLFLLVPFCRSWCECPMQKGRNDTETEKKAREGDSYLKKGCSRVKRYYVPTTELAPKALMKRRKAIRECMRKKLNN